MGLLWVCGLRFLRQVSHGLFILLIALGIEAVLRDMVCGLCFGGGFPFGFPFAVES